LLGFLAYIIALSDSPQLSVAADAVVRKGTSPVYMEGAMGTIDSARIGPVEPAVRCWLAAIDLVPAADRLHCSVVFHTRIVVAAEPALAPAMALTDHAYCLVVADILVVEEIPALGHQSNISQPCLGFATLWASEEVALQVLEFVFGKRYLDGSDILDTGSRATNASLAVLQATEDSLAGG